MSPYSISFILKAVLLIVCGVYFFIRYYRQGPPFLISIILLTTGLFDFRFQLEVWLTEHTVSSTTESLVEGIIYYMFVGANTLYHYLVLLFYLQSNELSMKKWAHFILLVPLAMSLILPFHYLFTAIWGMIYWLVSLLIAIRGMVKEHSRDKIINHLALALILLSNGLILVIAHFQGKEFIELVNLTWFSIFLIFCLLLLIWVNMRKMLVGMQRKAVVRKLDMGTALLHHSFKNAIGKVKINAWNIRNSLLKQSDLLPNDSVAEIDGYVQNLFLTYEHMMGMMSKISQIVRNRLVINKDKVQAVPLLEDALDAVENTYKVQIVKQFEQTEIHLDRALILECLINMIHNAIDAMQGEGILTLEAKAQGRKAVISVTDTGSGMTKEQLAQVFEPFYSTKGKTGKNMGLGLYYVRKVMEEHKGQVLIHSEPGKGTTVSLQFKQGRDWDG